MSKSKPAFQKGLSPQVVVVLVAAVLVGVGGFLFYLKPPIDKSEGNYTKEEMLSENDIIKIQKPDMSANHGVGERGTTEYSGEKLAGNAAPVLVFNKKDYDFAIASGKLVVLYFYANWCPICRQEVPEMYGAFNSLTVGQVIAFRVNYNDDETDEHEKNLAREFGVAYQHTKVFVKNGTRILKSPESWEKNRYLEEISKSLEK